MSTKAPNEMTFRHFVVILVNNDATKHMSYYWALKNLDKLQVVVSLKVLILTHRAMLYCSFINPLPFENLYMKME